MSVAACVASVLLFGVGSVGVREIASAAVRRLVMGAAMGGTAVMIIHSSMGKRSGAHFNPAITLTYLWLGKIGGWDAVGYVVGQFAGGVAGVAGAVIQIIVITFAHQFNLSLVVFAAVALSLAMLGPGAWSFDARLFGRKRII